MFFGRYLALPRSSSCTNTAFCTGNAIDVAAFVAADGHRIAVLSDWSGNEAEQEFLRAVRDGACTWFGTVLSPDYNVAHADHLHFDQADRAFGTVCR